MDAALNSKTACVSLPILADSLIAKNLSLQRSFKLLRQSPPAHSSNLNVGLQKYSKYLEIWDDFIGYSRDAGILSKWKQNVIDYREEKGREWMWKLKEEEEAETKAEGNLKKSNSSGSGGVFKRIHDVIEENLSFSKLRPFTLENFVFSFSVLVLGEVLSGGVFLLETLWEVLRDRKYFVKDGGGETEGEKMADPKITWIFTQLPKFLNILKRKSLSMRREL